MTQRIPCGVKFAKRTSPRPEFRDIGNKPLTWQRPTGLGWTRVSLFFVRFAKRVTLTDIRRDLTRREPFLKSGKRKRKGRSSQEGAKRRSKKLIGTWREQKEKESWSTIGLRTSPQKRSKGWRARGRKKTERRRENYDRLEENARIEERRFDREHRSEY